MVIDDKPLADVACPSTDSVTDSAPPISGVAAVSFAFRKVNDMAPDVPDRMLLRVTSVSAMNLPSIVRS